MYEKQKGCKTNKRDSAKTRKEINRRDTRKSPKSQGRKKERGFEMSPEHFFMLARYKELQRRKRVRMFFSALLLILLFFCLFACSKKQGGGICPTNESLPAATGAPTVLIIGDSISIGYTPTIEAALSPAYDVVHNPCNAMTSSWTAQNIDTWLASRSSFEAITWNNGLWDVADWENVSDSDYAANLHAIAQKIKAKTAHPLFILTTEVLPATPHRNNADVVNRNNIARDVMALEGIKVLDLYPVSQTIVGEHVSADDVHFTTAGSQVLGEAVLDSLDTLFGVN